MAIQIKNRSFFNGHPSLDLYSQMSRVCQGIRSAGDQIISRYNLNAAQFGALEFLERQGAQCQKDIAERLDLTEGNLTQLIDKLERNNLVRRERRTDDRRFFEIHLTEAGHKLLGDIKPEYQKEIEMRIAALTNEERTLLAGLVGKLHEAICTPDNPC